MTAASESGSQVGNWEKWRGRFGVRGRDKCVLQPHEVTICPLSGLLAH
jgi:hypothetical protein